MSYAGMHRLAPGYVEPEKPPHVYTWRSWAWDALCYGYPWLTSKPRPVLRNAPIPPHLIRLPTGTAIKPPPTPVPGPGVRVLK